jgi:putative transposase
MNRDIEFEVIGNTSPFSLMGESSCYMLTVNGQSYLVDCGTPIFPYLGYQGIAEINGIFATHSHEDHKRWFTDIVLFTFYNPLVKHKVRLISSETILDEYAKNSKGAIERSLSRDSKRIVDIPYESMVEPVVIGPRSKYFINLKKANSGSFYYQVEDRQGNAIGPEKAKIFINPAATRPRLLFKDDESREWVEPESYYCFESETFYEKHKNIFYDEKAGLTVQAMKSTVWHGVPTIAFKFTTEENSLFFSADTVYKPSLWRELWEEYRPQNFKDISRKEFDEKSILIGDINDFIERTWSRERYESAMSAYRGSVIIHDVARKNSIVHTDYPDIANAPFETIFFTHNPDNLTSWRPILTSRRKLTLCRGLVYESVKGSLYPYDADVYVHHLSGDFVGYRSEKGAYKVIENDGLLGVVSADDPQEGLMRVDLYQDIKGEYFPLLRGFNKVYHSRENGKVEELTLGQGGSSGRVVQNMRGKIMKGNPGVMVPQNKEKTDEPVPDGPVASSSPSVEERADPAAPGFFKVNAYPKTALKVHLVWVPKYRRRVLTGQIASRARDVLRRIALEHEIEIIAGNISNDHVHLFIAYGPTQNVNQIVQWFKDTSSQMLLSELAPLRSQFPGGSLWARGYLAMSSENITDEIILRYVEEQESEPGADDTRFRIDPS